MNICKTALGSTIVLLIGTVATAEEAWRTTGVETPESALFDPATQSFFLSNIAGPPNEKNGTGYIARLGADGGILEQKWATGLDAPKGLIMSDGTLYVSDVDRLVAIDAETGEITGEWSAEGAQFLNDTAVDGQGRIFVSDMLTNRIHVLEDDALSVWVEGEGLMHPNGLAVDGDTLIVAAWGPGLKEDFTTEEGGHLLAIDLATGEIGDYGSGEPVGNLDGIEPDGAGNWLVTDWIAGALLRIRPDGSFEQLLDLPQGSADLGIDTETGMVVIPLMMDDAVVAYSLE